MSAKTLPITVAASPEAITGLIIRIFRTNSRLLLAGDKLVAPLGLTSARWQLLGGIVAAQQPLPVVRLARDMGVSRQAVQRIANELEREGVVAFRLNPQHKRAQLVVLTDRGRDLYDKALLLQRPWATKLAEGITGSQIASACGALDLMLARLDAQPAASDEAHINSTLHPAGPPKILSPRSTRTTFRQE